MDRRQFLFGAAASAPLWGAASALAAQPGARDAELRALLDTFWNADLDAAPEMAGRRAGAPTTHHSPRRPSPT